MIRAIHGSITEITVDAIVNAANSSLLGGGGVDGAIHRVGGKTILDECIKIREIQGGCETGEAVITTAGNLPAKYVIHTVGPVWHGGQKDEKELLANAYTNSLKLATEYGVKRISFPNISTGVYRFPKELAVQVAIAAVTSYMEDEKIVEEVIFICFDPENHSLYQEKLKITSS